MSDCCSPAQLKTQKKKTILTVLILNAVMFFAQFSAAIFAHSTALLADSLDMLGDALTYSVSYYAINKNSHWLAGAALFKGIIIMIFSLGVFTEAIIKTFYSSAFPNVTIMIIFSIAGLLVNGSCFYLLTRYRHTDINMRSTWLCARNDMLGNVAVLLTTAFVYLLHSHWPDVIIGVIFAFILFKSALSIIKEALTTLKHPEVNT